MSSDTNPGRESPARPRACDCEQASNRENDEPAELSASLEADENPDQRDGAREQGNEAREKQVAAIEPNADAMPSRS